MGSEPKKALIQVLPYQKACLRDRPRFKILFWARGTRKSFTATLEIVDSIFEAEYQGKHEEWNIISRGERQALIEMAEIKRHFRAYNKTIQDITQSEVWSEFDQKHVKLLEIVTPKGSVVRALPANPDTIRGYTCNIYLAEFGVFPSTISQEIWKAAYPCLRGRLRMIVASTGKGKGNRFYQLATDDSGIWSLHQVDIYRAVQEGLPFDIETERKALNDEDAWAQEYELKWLDEASAWLSYDLIHAVEHEKAGQSAYYQKTPVFIGNDIARRNDLWVVWVLEPIGDVLWSREIIVRRNISFAEQDAIMNELFERYWVARLCMDQTGMGEKPVEDAQRRYGQSRVEGVTFTPATKLTIATIAKQAFQDMKIRIPMGDHALRSDLHSLKKVNSPTGAPRFVSEDSDGHADRAWACFLALYAAQNAPHAIEFQSIGRRVSAITTPLDHFKGFGTISKGKHLDGY